MINRHILQMPSLAEGFDFFNDYSDTLNWLQSLPSETPGRTIAIDKLKANYEVWLAKHIPRSIDVST